LQQIRPCFIKTRKIPIKADEFKWGKYNTTNNQQSEIREDSLF
jgi:hypothetical protein